MHCATCHHEHHRTEQVVRYTDPDSFAPIHDVVEETMLICTAPGCRCPGLDPTDYEDRLALIRAGELDA